MSPLFLYIVSCITILLLITITYSRLPPQIPLFYSLPAGNDQIADAWLIILIPAISCIFILCNNLVSRYLLDKNDFTDHITNVSNLVIIIASTYIFIKIIFHVAW